MSTKVNALIVLLVFLTSYCLGQNQSDNRIKSEKILYRGYSNPIHLNDLPFQQKGIKLVGMENVSLTQQDANTYFAIPSASSTTSTIQVLSQSDEVLGLVVFPVLNMPKPDLFLCGIQNGGSVQRKCEDLKLTFPVESQLTFEFKILSWECSYANAKTTQGDGENYALLGVMIADAPKGTSISILARVEGVDGMVRIANGTWTKD